MNPALGGTLTALGWGGADFIARFTGTALGHVTALFGMLSVSAVVLSGIVWGFDLPMAALASGWWWLLLLGVGLMLATLLLYRGLVLGPVTVVAPIVGSFPAFNIVIALMLGVRPSPGEWAAMLAVMAGVLLVARSTQHFQDGGHFTRKHLRVSVGISLASSFLFAITVAAGQEAGVVYGDLQAVCLARWVSLACCALFLLARREAPRIPVRWWPAIGFQALLDGGAYVALLAGSQGAGSAITAVVASTFSAVTVVLARVIIKEPMSWGQWGGIVLILIGVATLSGLRA